MSKSSGRGRTGLLSKVFRGPQVTVIDANVQRSWSRRALISFLVTSGVVGLLAAVVVSRDHHPIVGLFAGAGVGLLAGLVVGLLVLVWPVLRVFWHWAVEILTALLLLYGWTALMGAPLWLALPVTVVLAGVPAVVPPVRRRVVAVAWCVIVRHRLRVCFRDFIHAAGSVNVGNPPLILWARATPVGERVWIWLRSGLAMSDLEGRTDKMAVACWATSVRVTRSRSSYAALVQVDITRRDPLRATVASPLVGMVDLDDPTPVSPGPAPEGNLDLDLHDLTDAPAETPKPRGRTPRESRTEAPTVSVPVVDEYDAFI
ncbi:hypothetical protein Dvina_45100 [Dactylosporangium vinaceum]|uniref:Uncharacterized protein n=1 Tax=Dactylosporangium vinaceum TaxID=53362 RepID=A0ABV5MIM6_9ACTN|nr:hypothetical protein [Dactylosporangium vinaceum]UAB95153.1 hypothetical protein Dvina_45100 [Dactylosporangium vinaceum]